MYKYSHTVNITVGCIRTLLTSLAWVQLDFSSRTCDPHCLTISSVFCTMSSLEQKVIHALIDMTSLFWCYISVWRAIVSLEGAPTVHPRDLRLSTTCRRKKNWRPQLYLRLGCGLWGKSLTMAGGTRTQHILSNITLQSAAGGQLVLT